MKKKLLFVDDDQNFLAGMARLLRPCEQDWELILATSVPQAFQSIRENNIDVIISDIFMPGTDGMELLKFIKNGTQAHTIPIIMITGQDDVKLKHRAIKLGATDVLSKPIQFEALIARLLSTLLQKEYLDHITSFNATLVQKVNERTRELVEANKKLEKAQDEAELARETKSIFLRNISHELRTPLNTIIGFSEVMELNLKKKNETVEFLPNLKRINKAGRYLLKIIEGVLDFSKIETGKMKLNQVHFRLPDLIGEVDVVVRPMIDEDKLAILYEGDLEGVKIYADREKIKQILINLMENAIKFTHTGQITLTVLRRKLKKDFISFEISDTGIGMTKKQIENLFIPFLQGDPTAERKYGGSGFGLAISKSLALFLGGDIWVESKVGVGSTFNLTIPIVTIDSNVELVSNGE
jgi:signal transduction histidine kinase